MKMFVCDVVDMAVNMAITPAIRDCDMDRPSLYKTVSISVKEQKSRVSFVPLMIDQSKDFARYARADGIVLDNPVAEHIKAHIPGSRAV